MKAILSELLEGKRLSQAEAKKLLIEIGEGKHNHAQIAALLSIIAYRSVDALELAGFRDALLALAIKPSIDPENVIDIVGTGGDGKDTFNISTTSSFVVAGAGYKVAKHGNHGVSSSVGSSTVLEHLGIKFTNDSSLLNTFLDQAGICFFHAPLFHPAMRFVGPVRKELALKTFFNMLGPLVNPIQPKYNLFGTYNQEVLQLYDRILKSTDKSFCLVHALDGYDEVSLTSDTHIIFSHEKERTQQLTPASFGLSLWQQSDLYGGGTVEKSAELFLSVLKNESSQAHREVVLANASLAIKTLEPSKSLHECVAIAKESLEEGKALNAFKKLIALS